MKKELQALRNENQVLRNKNQDINLELKEAKEMYIVNTNVNQLKTLKQMFEATKENLKKKQEKVKSLEEIKKNHWATIQMWKWRDHFSPLFFFGKYKRY